MRTRGNDADGHGQRTVVIRWIQVALLVLVVLLVAFRVWTREHGGGSSSIVFGLMAASALSIGVAGTLSGKRRQTVSVTYLPARSGRGGEGASAPADTLLASDAGTFFAFGGQDVAVACVGVAPAQVGVQGPGLHGVVGVVGVGDGELP